MLKIAITTRGGGGGGIEVRTWIEGLRKGMFEGGEAR